jgi:6-phosphofructo-2-kinase/fructose-2,6-biphosphatase 2
VIHKHEGYLQSKIVYWVMNVHITPRTIYLTRHGESEHNRAGKIGGDSDISERGQQYAYALSYFFNQQTIPGLRVWTSWLKRTIQTSAHISGPQVLPPPVA